MTAPLARQHATQSYGPGAPFRARIGRFLQLIPKHKRIRFKDRLAELESTCLQRRQLGDPGTLISRKSRKVLNPGRVMPGFRGVRKFLVTQLFHEELQDAKALYRLSVNAHPMTLHHLTQLHDSADIFASVGFKRSSNRAVKAFVKGAAFLVSDYFVRAPQLSEVEQVFEDIVKLYYTLPYSKELFADLSDLFVIYGDFMLEKNEYLKAAQAYESAGHQMRHAKSRTKAISLFKKAEETYWRVFRSALDEDARIDVLKSIRDLMSVVLYQYDQIQLFQPDQFSDLKHMEYLFQYAKVLIDLGEVDEALEIVDGLIVKAFKSATTQKQFVAAYKLKLLIYEIKEDHRKAIQTCRDLIQYLQRFSQEHGSFVFNYDQLVESLRAKIKEQARLNLIKVAQNLT